jgi:hypothetical protein
LTIAVKERSAAISSRISLQRETGTRCAADYLLAVSNRYLSIN